MSRLSFCSAILLAVLTVCSGITTAYSEVVPDPNRGLYAIWSSSIDTSHMPYVVGGQAVVQWKDVESEENRYDFSKLRAQLKELDQLGRVTTVQLNANDHPDFLYSKVPHHREALNRQDRKGTLEYWHPDYIEAIIRLDRRVRARDKIVPYRARVIGVASTTTQSGPNSSSSRQTSATPRQWKSSCLRV